MTLYPSQGTVKQMISFLCSFFFPFQIVLILFSSSLGSQQNWTESSGSSHIYPAPTYGQAHPYQQSTCSATFVTVDEPTLTHHYNPKFIVYIRVHFWCYIFMGFDKNVISIYHYSIIQNNLIALKILCASALNSFYSHSPPPQTTT